jgi:hypothetical protein
VSKLVERTSKQQTSKVKRPNTNPNVKKYIFKKDNRGHGEEDLASHVPYLRKKKPRNRENMHEKQNEARSTNSLFVPH